MKLKFSLTVSDNLQIFGFYLLKSLSGAKNSFCSTLSEFENFVLCARILINVTTCHNETLS
jgi:hypothetical protein